MYCFVCHSGNTRKTFSFGFILSFCQNTQTKLNIFRNFVCASCVKTFIFAGKHQRQREIYFVRCHQITHNTHYKFSFDAETEKQFKYICYHRENPLILLLCNAATDSDQQPNEAKKSEKFG